MSFFHIFDSRYSSVRDVKGWYSFFDSFQTSSLPTIPPLNHGNYMDRHFLMCECASSPFHLLNVGCLSIVTPDGKILGREGFPTPILVDSSLFKLLPPNFCILCQDGLLLVCCVKRSDSFGCYLLSPQHSLLNINKVLFQSCNFHYGGYAI